MSFATREGTERFRARASVHEDAFSPAPWGPVCASIGLGTYLGAADEATDQLYEKAILRALDLGINVFDTALNYRCQRSERVLGRALAKAFDTGRAKRDEVVAISKVGFLPYDGAPAAQRGRYLADTFVKPGIVEAGEIVHGHHVLSGRFVRHGLGLSLSNLGLDAIDVYFLHNPEEQLGQIPRPTFLARLRDSIVALEEACTAGKIRIWGVATWDGLRQPPHAPDHLSLETIAKLTHEVAGDAHHFGAIELPYNLVMPQAVTRKTQRLDGEELTVVEAAGRLGLAVFTSASLHEARLLSRRLPDAFAHALPGATSQASRMLQFLRSTPGITTALVGMKQAEHLEENAEVLRLPRLTVGEMQGVRRALRG